MRNLKRVLALAMAMVMILGMMVIGSSAASYSDAAAIDEDYAVAVEVLSGMGVFKGTGAGFAPKQILTRAEAAALIYRVITGDTADKQVQNYDYASLKDIQAGQWYTGYVTYANNGGYIKGDDQGNFNPYQQVTGVQVMAIMLRAIGYGQNGEYEGAAWMDNILTDAKELGITGSISTATLNAPATRELVAQLIFNAISNEEAVMVSYAPLLGYYKAKDAETLAKKVFGLDTKTDHDIWGRPCTIWYDTTAKTVAKGTYATIAETPDVVYTEAVAECDIAADLGLKKDGEVVAVTVNANEADVADYFGADENVTLKATRAYVGAQGQLVEVYDLAKGIEVVIIDTFLAKVTGVTEVEYDKNGHIDEYAELDLVIYDEEDGSTKVTLYSDEDWEYSKFDMLLVNVKTTADDETAVDTDVAGLALGNDSYVEFVGEADSMIGAQTKITTKDSHVVEDEEYLDAVQLNLDDAGRSTAEFTWYFDQYGNLIGIEAIDAVYNYGVISSIYWKDSSDGEDGYAIAKITYMDGTSETATVYAAEGIGSTDKKGVVDIIEYGDIEDTKNANKKWCNQALYEISTSKNGLILTKTAELTDATIATGVSTIVKGEAYADKTTMFLIWTGKAYETYTGIKNIPTYDEAAGVWAATIGTKDTEAEYIFVIEPEADPAESQVLYFNADVSDVETDLKNEVYTVFGGYVNNEADVAIEIEYTDEDYDDNDVYELLEEYEGYLVVLDIEDGYVVDVTPVDDQLKTWTVDKGKTYAAYIGTVGVGATVNGKETLLYVGEDSYDIEDATLVGTKNWEKAEGKYAYVVYTENKYGYKTAEYVYVTNEMGTWENEPAAEPGTTQNGLNIEAAWGGLYTNIANVTFNESLALKLYSGKTLIAESYLSPDSEWFQTGGPSSWTANFVIDGENDETWPTTWYYCDDEHAPTSYEVWCDGIEMYESTTINYFSNVKDVNCTNWTEYLASFAD